MTRVSRGSQARATGEFCADLSIAVSRRSLTKSDLCSRLRCRAIPNGLATGQSAVVISDCKLGKPHGSRTASSLALPLDRRAGLPAVRYRVADRARVGGWRR
jgi:hypothetical protein